MEQFVKVIDALDEELYINKAEIREFKTDKEDSGTIITFKDGSLIYIKTKAEELFSFLKDCLI